MTMKNESKFEEELPCQFKIDLRNLTNLYLSTQNFKNLNFKGLLLTKVYNVSAKKGHRSYVWWQSGFMQNLKKNWIALSKMTWGIWQKKSDFILQSKMAELDQNQSSKQSDWLDGVWKLYFTLEINE